MNIHNRFNEAIFSRVKGPLLLMKAFWTCGDAQRHLASTIYCLLNWFRLLSTYAAGMKKVVKNTAIPTTDS